MKRRILLTGKNGQVGRELNRQLQPLGDVAAFDRQQLDLANPAQLREVVRSIQPEIIVNAAAYTAVDKAESDEVAARAINAEAPGILAEEARRLDALLVHYSTDYVFDGTKTTPYVEEDVPNPQNVYGSTKLAGENAIRQSGAAHLIFRTAWVYAQEGKNFVLTILRLATQREELKIVSDQRGAPTWSRDIGASTVKVLSQICRKESGYEIPPQSGGIYHLTAAGETNWYDFTRAILEEASRNSNSPAPWLAAATEQRALLVRKVSPILAVEYPTPARRPSYSVLSNARLAARFGAELPDWRNRLHSFFSE